MSCSEFQRSRDRQGYGRVWIDGRESKAHRVAYAEAHGLHIRDLDGKVVMHLCDNPPCVNPEHLALGSQAENLDDMTSKGRRATGANHGRASVDDATIERIKELRRSGLTQARIASMVGSTQSHVSRVLAGKLRA